MHGEHRNVREERERRIAALAAGQHGLVARRQLRELGLGADAIDYRLKLGRLHPLRRGVYLVGRRGGSRYAGEMAAVLACGPGALLSHRSGIELWRFLAPAAGARTIDVTVPGRDPGRKPGIRVHCVPEIDRRDAGTCRGIPVTRPARTLFDFAAGAAPRELEQAVAEAYARELVRPRDLRGVLEREGGRPGSAALRRLLERDRKPALARSKAEERMLAVLESAGLPPPGLNERLGPYVVDALWREPRLIVEVDGYATHSSRAAFERDRTRDADLAAHGWLVIRVTWRQLVERPETVVANIAAALERRLEAGAESR